MANLTFAQMGVNGQVVSELNEVLFAAVTDPESLGRIFTINKGIANGDKVFLVGDFGLAGALENSCNPDWDTANFVSTKTWVLDNIGISYAQCWADIPAPFLRQLSNLDGADARRNKFVADILAPKLESALKKMYLRFGWFADTRDNDVIAADLKTATNAKYFKANFSGIWSQALTAVTTYTDHLTSIAANEEETRAEQKDLMYTAGTPTGIVDDLIANADPALRQSTDGVIYMTLAFADALEWDIKHNNVGSDLQWNALKDGVKLAKYNGVTIEVIPAFDEIISLFNEDVASPYRALYTAKSNVQFATQGEGEIAELSIDYDPATKRVLMSALDHFGVMLAQDNIVSLAI